jgi:hypothetical protein
MKDEHDWLCISMPDSDRDYALCAGCMGKLINFLFIDTLLAYLFSSLTMVHLRDLFDKIHLHTATRA